MNKIIFIPALITLMGFIASAIAEPVAQFLPFNDMGKQMLAAQGKSEADLLNELPSKDAIGLPIYPGCYVGTSSSSNGVLSSIQFASKDTPDKIIAWYTEQLGEEWKFLPELATKQLGEVGVFVRTDKATVDAMDALRSQQIRITKVEKPDDTGFLAMTFDVTGVRAMINMQIKPFM